jgi:hypothetical protein
MQTLARDTSADAEAVLIDLLRRASPARMLAMTGLKERHPDESEAQLRQRFADLWLGAELAAKAYGPLIDR